METGEGSSSSTLPKCDKSRDDLESSRSSNLLSQRRASLDLDKFGDTPPWQPESTGSTRDASYPGKTAPLGQGCTEAATHGSPSGSGWIAILVGHGTMTSLPRTGDAETPRSPGWLSKSSARGTGCESLPELQNIISSSSGSATALGSNDPSRRDAADGNMSPGGCLRAKGAARGQVTRRCTCCPA